MFAFPLLLYSRNPDKNKNETNQEIENQSAEGIETKGGKMVLGSPFFRVQPGRDIEIAIDRIA